MTLVVSGKHSQNKENWPSCVGGGRASGRSRIYMKISTGGPLLMKNFVHIRLMSRYVKPSPHLPGEVWKTIFPRFSLREEFENKFLLNEKISPTSLISNVPLTLWLVLKYTILNSNHTRSPPPPPPPLLLLLPPGRTKNPIPQFFYDSKICPPPRGYFFKIRRSSLLHSSPWGQNEERGLHIQTKFALSKKQTMKMSSL